MIDFSSLTLSPALRANLDKLGFEKPTPVQTESIPPAMEGRDVVATAQTGTGKTLAFALPLLQRLISQQSGPKTGIKAVVLSPTRELAIQINESFGQLIAGTGVRTAVVVGGMDESRQLAKIRQGAHIVIATPGRLCDFLQRRLVKLGAVEVIVLDEADRMLDMGFLPSLSAILKELPTVRQTLLFSATIETSVAHLIKDYVTDPVRVSIGVSTKPAEQVNLHLYEVELDRKHEILIRLLHAHTGAFLVFTRTKRGADRLAKNLEISGIEVARIHGDRSQGQRNQALQGFKNGTHRVLVATDVAARGIHVDNIAHVVNFDLPEVPEDFIHRVGRTGRAGAMGTASTFMKRAERDVIRRIERALATRLTKMDAPPPVPADFKPAPKVIAITAAVPQHRGPAAKTTWRRRRFASR